MTDPSDLVARALNTLPKYVASKTLDKLEWDKSTLIQGNVVEEITKLKRRPVRSSKFTAAVTLAQTLIENDLVDEYRLWSFPVVLGRGKRPLPVGNEGLYCKIVKRPVAIPPTVEIR